MVRLFSPTRASALSLSAAGPCRRFLPDPGVNVVGDEDRDATGQNRRGSSNRRAKQGRRKPGAASV
jgi:hypothetical protein